jgi:hypothetical protein
MMFAGAGLGSSALAAQTALSTALVDPEHQFPLHVELDTMRQDGLIEPGSIQGTDPLGEQGTCLFTVINPTVGIYVGMQVRVRYFAEVLFSGTIDRVEISHNHTLTKTTYRCTCVDWSQILARHKLTVTFTHSPVPNILDALLDHDLAGNGLTIGQVDQPYSLPLAQSKGGSALDFLKEIGATTGQVLVVDQEKRLSYYATANLPAPLAIQDAPATIMSAELTHDREDYRNVQKVIATGTPASASNEDAVEVTVIQENTEQIADRAAIERNSGRYEALDEITHPTSNVMAEVRLLAESYATVKLAVAGTLHTTLRCRLRGYGFRSGQTATVLLAALGLTGTWTIQKSAWRDEAGRRLIYDLDLTPSTLLQRAYQSWLAMIDKGQIIAQAPGTEAPVTQSVSFTTAGVHNWVVPAGVTSVQLTVMGGSGGGGGGCYVGTPTYGSIGAGGYGGKSGQTRTTLNVTPGQTLLLTIGAKGLGGANGAANMVLGTDGTDGADTTVTRDGVLISMAAKGGKGLRGYFEGGPFGSTLAKPGATGAAGGGSNGIVTVGGGKTGGRGGSSLNHPFPYHGAAGTNGSVTIDYTAV